MSVEFWRRELETKKKFVKKVNIFLKEKLIVTLLVEGLQANYWTCNNKSPFFVLQTRKVFQDKSLAISFVPDSNKVHHSKKSHQQIIKTMSFCTDSWLDFPRKRNLKLFYRGHLLILRIYLLPLTPHTLAFIGMQKQTDFADVKSRKDAQINTLLKTDHLDG